MTGAPVTGAKIGAKVGSGVTGAVGRGVGGGLFGGVGDGSCFIVEVAPSDDDDGFVVDAGGGMNHVFVFIAGDIGGIQKSSKLDGEKENCSTWTFFKPASFALRSASFNE